MANLFKIVIPIFLILSLLASVMLGVSCFSTSAHADTSEAVMSENEKLTCYLDNSFVTTASPNDVSRSAYFTVSDFYDFALTDVDSSGYFALTYHITPGDGDNTFIPSGRGFEKPYFSFKFTVYPVSFSSGSSSNFEIYGNSDFYNGEWNQDDRCITFDTNLVISETGFYTFYFKIPSRFFTCNHLVITGSYRIINSAGRVFGYKVRHVDNGYTGPFLRSVGSIVDVEYQNGLFAGYNAGYTEGYNSGLVSSDSYYIGYDDGHSSGYNVGYTEGLSSAEALDGTGLGPLGGTISATVNMIVKALDVVGNVNVFGITIWSLIGLAVAIGIITLIVKLIKR